MQNSHYSVKTNVFEGPFDLLLTLIEKRKLFINDISLAQVTDDYINHLKSAESFPISKSAHFILIASTLLLIKSKSLLPVLSLTEEEESSIDDLELRLKVYSRIRELVGPIKLQFGTSILFSRIPSKDIVPVFSPSDQMNVENLRLAIHDIVNNLPKEEKIPRAVVNIVISLEETITRLTDRIRSGLRMSFNDFSKIKSEDKVNVIVSFLAMLELVKQGIIQANQEKMFDDIQMETNSISVPSYN